MRSFAAEMIWPANVSSASAGLVDVASAHSVDETVERLQAALQAKGVPLFTVIDHSGEAAKVGLTMPATKLLVFGNPRAGTPIMLAAPRSAIDLPLKLLVWQDGDQKVWITYNSLDYLGERHHLAAEMLRGLAVVETLASQAAGR
ncbi:MAG TPA: DUF302 domain-containing protein [Polyangia bacterium]|jgi:uncharacterized protein (DUF302 family)